MLTDGEVSMQEDFKSNDGISKPLSLFFSSLAEIWFYAMHVIYSTSTQNAQHIWNL